MKYIVKDNNDKYFVKWTGQIPYFNPDKNIAKQFSKTGAEDLIKSLAEKNLGLCEMVQVSGIDI